MASSCVGGKYTYNFDTGKSLDFGNGRWIFNEVGTNSTANNNKKLYEVSYAKFKRILGDSLIDLTSLRNIALVKPEIEFDPTSLELKKLYVDSQCDFLINIRGNEISNSASSFYTNEQNSNYSTSNMSSVDIKIFDLKTGMLISSSSGQAKSTEQHSVFEKDGKLNWTTRAEPMMIRAAEGLIRKYDKNRRDK